MRQTVTQTDLNDVQSDNACGSIQLDFEPDWKTNTKKDLHEQKLFLKDKGRVNAITARRNQRIHVRKFHEDSKTTMRNN
jgi:hypothetical protein